MGRGSREKAKAKNKGKKQPQKTRSPFNTTKPEQPQPTPEETPQPTPEETPQPTPEPTTQPTETTEETAPETPTEEIATMQKKQLNQQFTNNKPLNEKLTQEEETTTKRETEEEQAPETEEQAPTETPTETEEKKIIPIKEETKIITYKDIFKTIEDFYEQNKGIEETFTKLESVINNMSDKMFDETFETVAEGIFNTTINGKKVFNTLEDAKKFIYEIRYNGKRSFRGKNTLKYKLPKKLQEGLKQEKQENQQLTPMMKRNIKQVPSSKYIYQY